MAIFLMMTKKVFFTPGVKIKILTTPDMWERAERSKKLCFTNFDIVGISREHVVCTFLHVFMFVITSVKFGDAYKISFISIYLWWAGKECYPGAHR